MREILRVRQLPHGAQDFTPPEVLVEELNRMTECLKMLIPVYPVIGKQLESLAEMCTNMQI